MTVTSLPQPTPVAVEPGPAVPWLVAAVVGPLAALLLGWLAVGLIVFVGWLAVTSTPASTLVATIGQGWLALHFATARFGDTVVGVAPLGLVAAVIAGMAAATAYAARGVPLSAEASLTQWGRAFGALVGVCTAAYAVGALVLASLVGTPTQASDAFPGALGIALTGAVLGGVFGLRPDAVAAWPAWLRACPGAVLAGLASLFGAGLLAVAVGLGLHWQEATAMVNALNPDAIGVVGLGLAHLAWLPTIAVWGASYALGAGLSLGTGSVVTPGVTQLGLLPALPVLAAVPPVGSPLAWGWLWTGVAAGVVCGGWLVRALSADAHDPDPLAWAWQAAVAGSATVTTWWVIAWVSRGDLGTGRLVGLGPVFPDLLWWSLPPVVGGAAATAALTAWWSRRRAQRSAPMPGESAGVAAPDAD